MAARSRLLLPFLVLPVVLGAVAVALTPGAAHASGSRALALEDLVAESNLIVLGTITELDEHAGVKLGPDKPLTRIKVDVERVLRGSVTGKQVSFQLRVGYLPDGGIVQRSDTPELSLGDRYVLFLRTQNELAPLVPAQQSILRVVTFGKRPIVVDESGRAILASQTHGFVMLGQVAASLEARTVERLRAQDDQDEGGLEPPAKQLALGDVDAASDLEDVLNMISAAAARVDRTAAKTPTIPVQQLNDRVKP